MRQGQRFQTGRREPEAESEEGAGLVDGVPAKRVKFQRSSRLRNKHIRSRSLILLMVLLALVLAAIAMLA